MAKFVVFYNGEHLKTYVLDEPVISIGRLPENTISIANMGISRRHSKIEEDADRKLVLSDLNSLNGTYVNGKRVKKIMLQSGDKIAIGKYTILFEESALDTKNISENPYAASSNDSQNSALGPIESKTELGMAVISEQSTPNNLVQAGSQNDRYVNSVLIETNKHVVYKLDKSLLTMGNSENDDIFISGFMIGEGQITIEKEGDGLRISANKFMGKFKVNGRSLKSHHLKHKDRIEVGANTFRFMENG